MSRWDRFFLVVQRTSSVLVILVVILAVAMFAKEWLEMRRYENAYGGNDVTLGRAVRKSPYSGRQIETSGGSLVTIFQQDDESAERVELGGITIANTATGKSIEIAPDSAASVIQFELIFERGGHGKAIGYLATTATPSNTRTAAWISLSARFRR
jgi:DNA-binding transcriptional regulator of glucitol operon